MINELSIIIPTLNEEKYLPKLLESIISQNFDGKLEVIVVDGKSEDKTKEKAKEFIESIKDLSIIDSDRGISKQRNKGAVVSKYEYILFLDADMVLPNNYLNKISKKFFSEKDFVVLPLILPDTFNLFDYVWDLFAYLLFFLVSSIKPVVAGMTLLTTKSNHKKIGGFDEKAIYAEDMDYGWRSIKAGAKYHLVFDIYAFSSTRRRQKIPRIKLFFKWMWWYFKGPIYKEDKNYTFGDFD